MAHILTKLTQLLINGMMKSFLSLQRRKRATDGLSVMATIGNNSVKCGPKDIVCNGPLDSNAQYGVRYTLFSGDQFQEYPFFEEAQFTTGECVCIHELHCINWT